MKTSIIIVIATALTLQYNNLIACVGNPTVHSKGSESTQISLAPTTPAEATFEDAVLVNDNDNIAKFAPITPKEADFSDNVPESNINLKSLAPVTPVTAIFEDEDETDSTYVNIADITTVPTSVPDTL
jgi:hypothetical protein